MYIRRNMAIALADIHVKVNPEIKSASEDVLSKIGISMSDYINMALRRVVREQRIPFDTSVLAEGAPRELTANTREEFLKILDDVIASEKEHPETYDSKEILSSLEVPA